ncbi:MAG: HlyD family type I secretion periplasmic adaptor subunit [Caulobacteraceae bacterium]|nr:HlyD family type I secretion periplasmic adaptor subunit [Caulobacter sp.]
MSSQLPTRTDGRAVGFGFGPERDDEAVPPRLAKRISRHIALGMGVVLFFVVGLGIWAALSPVAGAVPAQGTVKVENNRKTIKHLEPGVIDRILVREGDHVRAGQVMFELDPAQAQAQVATLAAANDSLLAERARWEAEARGASAIAFPPELLARRSDPQVAAAMASQEALFTARRAALQSQVDVGAQREAELGSQIQGLKAQVAATNSQLAYNTDELNGVQSLYSGGYAPKTRLLALQRQDAGLKGQRGDQSASIARAQQSIGETRLQVLSTRQARIQEAAQGLETTQDKLSDVQPKLAAARELLAHTEVRSPVDGTVLNLTQFTEGAAIGSGETLAEVVPTGAPLVIQVQVRPQDVHAVHPGQRSLITLTAYNSRTTPRIFAEVTSVAPDQTLPQTAGAAAEGVAAKAPFFLVDMRIPPDQLKRLPSDVRIYPGMPVSTSIVTGERTVLGYILSPFRDMLHDSLHE